MPEPESSAIPRYQVLADPTGRRRHRMAIAGRAATIALGLWLLVLMLGGLGLQPLAGLPIVGDLGAGDTAPPALPERVQIARDTRTSMAPGARAPEATAPVTPLPAGAPRRRAETQAPGPARRRPSRKSPTPNPTKPSGDRPAGTLPATTAPGSTGTLPGSKPPAPAPARTPGPSTSAPGQQRTPPGQAKPGPGRPVTTPGTTRAASGSGRAGCRHPREFALTGVPDPADSPQRRSALRFRLRHPPTRWGLLGTCLVLLAALITFQGFSTHAIGASSEASEDRTAGTPLKGSQPLLVARSGHLHSPQPDPGKRIALTFDDGPDPRWTPKILDVLRRGARARHVLHGRQSGRPPPRSRARCRARRARDRQPHLHARRDVDRTRLAAPARRSISPRPSCSASSAATRGSSVRRTPRPATRSRRSPMNALAKAGGRALHHRSGRLRLARLGEAGRRERSSATPRRRPAAAA